MFGGKLPWILRENEALQFQRLQSAEAADEWSEQIRSVEYSQLREWPKFSYFTHFESRTTFDIPKQLWQLWLWLPSKLLRFLKILNCRIQEGMRLKAKFWEVKSLQEIYHLHFLDTLPSAEFRSYIQLILHVFQSESVCKNTLSEFETFGDFVLFEFFLLKHQICEKRNGSCRIPNI